MTNPSTGGLTPDWRRVAPDPLELTDVTICDVTLRDGGYLNGHTWRLEQAVHIVRAASAAGVLFSEVGYYRPDEPHRPPASKCDAPYLRALNEAGTIGMMVMAKPTECDPADLTALADHGVVWVRLPSLVTAVARTATHIAAARASGLTCSVNLIRISEHPVQTLVDAACRAEDQGADVIYLADSNGSLTPARVAAIVSAIRPRVSASLGFHAHDNLRLAFSNTLAAVAAGCDRVDGTIAGIGKGGGNLRTELFLACQRAQGSATALPWPMIDVAPVLANERTALERGAFDAVVGGLLDLNLDALQSQSTQDLRRALDSVARTEGAA